MQRSLPVLPRVRISLPGSPVKQTPRPLPWAVVFLLCGLLLLTGYARIAGRLRLGDLTDGSKGTRSKGSNSVAASVAVPADQFSSQHATSTAAAVEHRAVDVMGMQSMQSGMDFVGNGDVHLLSTTQQQNVGAVSSFLAAHPAVLDATDALSRRPAVHGHVKKAGISDPLSWLKNHTDDRLDSFLSWRLNKATQGTSTAANSTAYTCSAADHPPLPFPGCHVFVNHQYKYIYIRSPKSASTSIVNVLGECHNTRTRGYNSSSCMALHFYWPSSTFELDNLRQMWSDYFVFAFVRNPWRRAYSLYKYIHSSGCMDDASLKNPECRVPWAQFCADPWSAAEQLHDKGCIKRTKSYLYFHMVDQFHCMRTAEGDWAVDFVGRVDEPNEDWAEVIKTLNAQRAPGEPELPVGELEQQNVQKNSDKDPFNTAQTQCLDRVSQWYACDIEKYSFAGPKLH